MPVLSARSRLVSFRLTQDELENLKVACLIHGARNISDFARGAALQLANARTHPQAQIVDRFSALELRLTEIESTLKHNTDMVRALLKKEVRSRESESREADA